MQERVAQGLRGGGWLVGESGELDTSRCIYVSVVPIRSLLISSRVC